jgi:hypothetical protein
MEPNKVVPDSENQNICMAIYTVYFTPSFTEIFQRNDRYRTLWHFLL